MATDAHAHDDEHGDDYHHHQHIATIRGNLIIFGLLLACTALTIGAYMVRLGEANLLVALLIAGVKATLVCTFFMHLKYEQRFNILFFLGSFLFVGVFVGYTLNDTDHRGDDVQGVLRGRGFVADLAKLRPMLATKGFAAVRCTGLWAPKELAALLQVAPWCSHLSASLNLNT